MEILCGQMAMVKHKIKNLTFLSKALGKERPPMLPKIGPSKKQTAISRAFFYISHYSSHYQVVTINYVTIFTITKSKPSNTSSFIYKFNWTTCFGLEDHLQVLRAKVCATLRLKELNGIPLCSTVYF
jgi:hypothetical protein